MDRMNILAAVMAALLIAGCIGADTTPTDEGAETTLSSPTSTAAREAATSSTVQGAPTTTTATEGTVQQATATTGAASPPGQFIAKASDVPPGSSLDFTYGGEPAILVNIGGTYAAYVNKCTHKGCPNKFDGNALTCPCHGSQFDPATGEALKGPAKTPLSTIEVIASGDSVYAG
jgi:nitrite reductase/ring-hydroxylating ferredoxin subunit